MYSASFYSPSLHDAKQLTPQRFCDGVLQTLAVCHNKGIPQKFIRDLERLGVLLH